MTNEPDKAAVSTGSSSGIGRAAAKAIIAKGWRIIGHGRNRQRREETVAEIRDEMPGASSDFVYGDLSIMPEAKRVANAIKALTPRIDVLANNAGTSVSERV